MFQVHEAWERFHGGLFPRDLMHSYVAVYVPFTEHLFHVDVRLKKATNGARWCRFIYASIDEMAMIVNPADYAEVRITVQLSRFEGPKGEYAFTRLLEIIEGKIDDQRIFVYSCANDRRYISMYGTKEENLSDRKVIYKHPVILGNDFGP